MAPGTTTTTMRPTSSPARTTSPRRWAAGSSTTRPSAASNARSGNGWSTGQNCGRNGDDGDVCAEGGAGSIHCSCECPGTVGVYRGVCRHVLLHQLFTAVLSPVPTRGDRCGASGECSVCADRTVAHAAASLLRLQLCACNAAVAGRSVLQ